MAQTQLARTPFISEPLTWEQICQRYPDEWVCLVEIDRPEAQNFAFHTARVVGHGKHPDDPFMQARPLRDQYEGMGHYFTGRVRDLSWRWMAWNATDGGEDEAMTQTRSTDVPVPFISEPLTWDQICERYPDEWVCLVEIDSINDTDFAFRTARVVGHGKHPDEPFVQARPIRDRYEGMGHYFTGRARARMLGVGTEVIE